MSIYAKMKLFHFDTVWRKISSWQTYPVFLSCGMFFLAPWHAIVNKRNCSLNVKFGVRSESLLHFLSFYWHFSAVMMVSDNGKMRRVWCVDYVLLECGPIEEYHFGSSSPSYDIAHALNIFSLKIPINIVAFSKCVNSNIIENVHVIRYESNLGGDSAVMFGNFHLLSCRINGTFE